MSPHPTTLNLANILSDLTLLRACDASDALRLVTLPAELQTTPSKPSDKDSDPELKAAFEFMALHARLRTKRDSELDVLKAKIMGTVRR